MYEPRHSPPIPRRHFARRVANHFAVVCALFLGSLLVGMAGYAHFEGLAWHDAFLNAAMILGGMGPVSTMQNGAAKIFAGCYALFAGLVFIGSAAVLVSPWLHRLLYRLHAEADEES